MSQSAIGVRQALFTELGVLFPDEDTLILYGPAGNYQTLVMVSIGQSRSPITRPTMTTNRSREKVLETDVVFSVLAPGGEESQVLADDRAWSMVDAFEAYFRTSPNERLGGACRDSLITNTVHDSYVGAETLDDGESTPAGRVAEITVTVLAVVRY